VELGFISLSYLDSLSHLRRIVFVESEANDLQRQLNETSRGRSQFGWQSTSS